METDRLKGPLCAGVLLTVLVVAACSETVAPQTLKRQLKQKNAPLIVDVRSRAEYVRGHLPTAIHLPFWSVLWRHPQIPLDQAATTVLYCESGPRAIMARGLLALVGKGSVRLLDGHMQGWRRAGLPLRPGSV